jgi:hypothetical protein
MSCLLVQAPWQHIVYNYANTTKGGSMLDKDLYRVVYNMGLTVVLRPYTQVNS